MNLELFIKNDFNIYSQFTVANYRNIATIKVTRIIFIIITQKE